jgi:GntR family transcriptional regulator, arabinose operon transcriptional repressor
MGRRESPKHRQVLDALLADLNEDRYRPGEKFPSEAALVKRFAVSRITVAHALRELQRQGRIVRVAGSGTYVRGAANATREGLVFGLIIPNLGETEIFEPICQAIAASHDAGGHALLWPHAARATSKEDEAIELCGQCIARGVAGVFFAPLEMAAGAAEANHRVMRALREAKMPVVLLDRRPGENPTFDRADLAGIDNHLAGYLAAEHLVRLGARRIGFLGLENQALTVKPRIAGYRDALAGAPERVFLLPAASRFILPADAAACDAFVCSNDRIAGHLMHALLAEGQRIPQDVRIVGIDDVNYASLLPVPLTTVHQPCREIGETALRLMLERLDRPSLPAREVLLECSLVIRESCGAR